MIRTLLVANRGEIACRIIRTARDMGIHTVAVYSEADAGAMHVRQADEARLIGPAAAAQSYLCIDAVIAAALQSGADAIHPGYGFLSENAAFARACADAGLCFVGPPVAAIEAMGSKRAALTLMAAHGVPVLPGYHGEGQSDQALIDAARAIGFPLIIKPSAGGGGKGMQIAHELDALPGLLASTRRIAQAAFGDDTLLLERYLPGARHIEIQVFADSHGHCVHLYERDCSLQRRHQKIVEEAPAADLTPALREQMAEVALRAARAIDYRGAGTVEFLYDPRDPADGPRDRERDQQRFFFMEMNTRLQVEHPVTEMITGVDLVKWQLLVAAGRPLPLEQKQIVLAGHAIEARVYAEDPQRDFLPASGPVHWLHLPANTGVRVDAGVEAGDQVSAHYDPMVAKLIVHGETRAQAIARMREALHLCDLGPLPNNIGFLRDLAAHPGWLHGVPDTAFLEREAGQLRGRQMALPDAAVAANAWIASTAPRAPADPWQVLRGMRLNLASSERSRIQVADTVIDCDISRIDETWTLHFSADDADPDFEPVSTVHALRREAHGIVYRQGDRQRRVRVHSVGGELWLDDGTARRTVRVLDNATPAQAGQVHGAGQLLSPMPGRVVSVSVAIGDRVELRQALAVIEAMKMEHTLIAPGPGVVSAVNCTVDAQVDEGVVLIAIELD